MANLISNGIDAHYDQFEASGRREVRVSIAADKRTITIRVEDWGRGIPAQDRTRLFEPFFSTKQTGMGMGLFIAKQIVQEHFLGDISVDTTKKHTAFVVTFPKADI